MEEIFFVISYLQNGEMETCRWGAGGRGGEAAQSMETSASSSPVQSLVAQLTPGI